MWTDVASYFSSSLKSRLFALTLLGFLPAFGFAIYSAVQDYRDSEATAEQNATQLARLISADHQQLVDGAIEFLTALSQAPLMSDEDDYLCRATLLRVKESLQDYRTLEVFKPNGELFCNGALGLPDKGAARLDFFREAIATRNVSLGPYAFDLATNQPVLYIAKPLLIAPEKITGVIVAGISLPRFDKVPDTIPMPKDSVIVVFEEDGFLFARYPSLNGAAGKPWPETPLLAQITKAHLSEGTTSATGLDGVDRLYAFNVIHKTANQTVYLAVGFPMEALRMAARKRLNHALIDLGIVYFLVAIAVWVGGNALIIRKMESLIRAAQRMRDGDLSARTGLQNSLDEVGQLALAFDDMAQKMQNRVNEIGKLREMNESLQSCLTHEEVYLIVRQFSHEFFPRWAGALYLTNKDNARLEARLVWNNPRSRETFNPPDCWALRRGKGYCVQTGSPEPHCNHIREPFTTGYVCASLSVHGEIIGMLHLQSAPSATDEDECASLPLAETIAENTAITLSGIDLRESLRAQAIRDGLTGLFNRRHMEEALAREARRADRNNAPFSVIMIDIDYFKRFNDAFGHAAGDALLRECGNLFQRQMRGEDLACRYGGEEFTVILPGTPLENASAVAEKLRESVQTLTVRFQGEALSKVTISLGVASYPVHGSSWEATLYAADVALMAAKRTRNRVVIYEDEKDIATPPDKRRPAARDR